MAVKRISRSEKNEVLALRICKKAGITGDKKFKLVVWMINRRNENNLVMGTLAEIAKLSGYSETLVKKAMKTLQESGNIERVRCGTYLLKLE